MDYNSEISDVECSDSEIENDFDMCCISQPNCYGLSFDTTSLENVILSLSDRFNFRVIFKEGKLKNAFLITTGLSLAGSVIGKHYGGKIGAAVGGAVGGVCGLGIIVVSMRDVWEDIKGHLSELFDIVYDYLAGLGINDYKMAAEFLITNSGDSIQLAKLILNVTSDILGKKIISSLNAQ